MKNKIIIFENISLKLIPVIYLYLLLGYKIKYMKVISKIEKMKWFKKQKIKKINCGNFYSKFYYKSSDITFEKGEEIYEKYYKNSKTIKNFEILLNTKFIHLIFKKVIFKKIQYAFDINLMLNNLSKNYDKIIFFPSQFFEIMSSINYKSNNKIKISLFSYILFFVSNSINKIKYLFIIILLPLWIRIHIKKIIPNTKPKKYQLGIRIYKNDWAFYDELRKIDFLLDNKKINKNNTLFCIENDISKDYLKKLEEKNYNKVQMPKILTKVDTNFLNEILNIKFLYNCIRISLFSLLEKNFLIKLSPIILYEYLIWKQFFKKYYINNYVTYNEFTGPNPTIRNILLNQNDIKTYLYIHSCHFSYVFPKHSREIEWCFLYFDYFISWNNSIIKYLKTYPSFIKKYINNGVLWSEHIRMIMEREFKSNILKELQKKINIKNMKIISIFDTTFGNVNSLINDDDMSLFIEYILKLLNDFPNIIIIFKEKFLWKDLMKQNHDAKVISLYKKLKSHKRCYVCNKMAEVHAISNLVISACFTSSTIEALGARKKAIYFDANSKFKNSYYDKIPNLVAHGYDDLKKLVKYWLCDITDYEFDEYLEKYIKGELDAYVDGKAITRFRNLLINDR